MSDPVNGAQLGETVAISADGNYAIVGAPQHTSSGTARGQAYIFIRSGTSWVEQKVLAASDKSNNAQFGVVAISSDGTYAVVGAPGAGSGGSSRGQAYIFIRSGVSWTEQQILQATDEDDGAIFGNSVSIDSTGTYVVIGAAEANSGGTARGQAYIFIRSGASWTEQQILQASDEANGVNFGRSVAIYGTRVIVTAPHANGAGSDRGQAYIFNRSGTTWTQQKILTASDAQNGALFGGSSHHSTSMCESYASVGSQDYDSSPATDNGKVYVFSGKQTLDSGVLSSGIVETSMCRITSPVAAQNVSIPAISHTVNANSGVYFPLDNTVGLSAGGLSSALFGANGFSSTVQPFLYVEHNAEQKISNNTATTALFNTTLQSQGSAISISNGVVTVSQSGIYAFYTKINWKTNAGTGFLREIYFTVSSQSGRRPGTVKVQMDPTFQLVMSTSMCVKLTAADTVSLTVYQNTNLDEMISANANVALSNELMVYKVC
jgi:hypothetical protein